MKKIIQALASLFLLLVSIGIPIISIAEEKSIESSNLDQSNLKIDLLDDLDFPSIEEPIVTEDIEEVPEALEEIVEDTVIDSDHSDLAIISSGAFWTLGRSKETNDMILRMYGNVPSSRPSAWNNYLKSIQHVEIVGATMNGNFASYFAETTFQALERVIIEKSDLTAVTSFESTFRGKGSGTRVLKECIIRNNQSSDSLLTTTESMFHNALRVQKIDLSGLDTSSVVTMKNMFRQCQNLKEVDLTNLVTRSVKDMGDMFYGCQKLKELDLSSFDTSSVTNMENMFASCYELAELDLSSFNTSSVTNMRSMITNCYELAELDLSSFDTSSVTSMRSMFANCYELAELDLSSFDTSSVTSMENMIANCYELAELDLSSFDTSLVTSVRNMFANCYELAELDLSSFDTSSVTNMTNLFDGCVNLEKLYLCNFTETESTSGMKDMWANTGKISYLSFGKDFCYLTGLSATTSLPWLDQKYNNLFTTLPPWRAFHLSLNEPNTYVRGRYVTLTMNAMGGKFEDNSNQLIQHKLVEEKWDNIVPTKEDYYFEGWYIDQNYQEKFDLSMPAAASATIYAKWVENYTVIIPASVSLNDKSELKIEGINRGDKTLAVGMDREKTIISDDNKLTLANSSDSTVQCLADLSWNGSESNSNADILTVLPSLEITEGKEILSIQAPSGNIQAGKYEGNIVFLVKYE